jgi:cell division protein FtsL
MRSLISNDQKNTLVEVFWVVTPCSVAAYIFSVNTEAVRVLRNVATLPQHYTVHNPEDMDCENLKSQINEHSQRYTYLVGVR